MIARIALVSRVTGADNDTRGVVACSMVTARIKCASFVDYASPPFIVISRRAIGTICRLIPTWIAGANDHTGIVATGAVIPTTGGRARRIENAVFSFQVITIGTPETGISSPARVAVTFDFAC